MKLLIHQSNWMLDLKQLSPDLIKGHSQVSVPGPKGPLVQIFDAKLRDPNKFMRWGRGLPHRWCIACIFRYMCMMLSRVILVSLRVEEGAYHIHVFDALFVFFQIFAAKQGDPHCLTLLQSERPKLHTILAFLITKGLRDEEGACHIQIHLMYFYFSDIWCKARWSNTGFSVSGRSSYRRRRYL